jgi:hypothetical protein
MDWKNTGTQVLSKFNPVSALILAMVALGAYLYGQGQRPATPDQYTKEVNEWRTKANDASKQATDALRKIDSLKKENQSLDKVNDVLDAKVATVQHKALNTKRQLDSALAELEHKPLPVECEPYVKLATRYRGVSDSLIIAIVTKDDIIMNKTVQINNLNTAVSVSTDKIKELQQVIANSPKPPKPVRILGIIPAPSRKVSFMLGVIATLGGVVALQ